MKQTPHPWYSKQMKPDETASDVIQPVKLTLYAWVGEDERGGGKIGLKQGMVPAGFIPLVAMDYDLEKLERLAPQMEAMSQQFGKKIRLCKFVMEMVVFQTEGGD
jgi:hypothetical protein